MKIIIYLINFFNVVIFWYRVMINRIVNLLYTTYFNLRYLPFSQAIKFPILIHSNIRIEKLKRGQIIVENPKRFQVLLGTGKSPSMNSNRGCIHLDTDSRVVFKGNARLSEGTVLRCDGNGVIEFGSEYYCNCNCYFRSCSLISFWW